MDNIDVTADAFDKCLRRDKIDECQFIIICGESGIGKSDIVKQFLSRTDCSKIYANGIWDIQTSIDEIVKIDNLVIVIDHLESGLTSNIGFILRNEFINRKCRIFLITNLIKIANEIKEKLSKIINENNFDNDSAVFLNLKVSYISDYTRAATRYGVMVLRSYP